VIEFADGVEYKNLGELSKIETGKLNANAAVENGEYLFFTTAKTISRINKYRWDTEAILIAGNANVGEVKHYKGKFDAYQRTYVLTQFSKMIKVRFLYFFLSSNLKQYLESRSNSAAMTYIVLSTLQDFPIPIPPSPFNRRSSEILDTFTELEAELERSLRRSLRSAKSSMSIIGIGCLRLSLIWLNGCFLMIL
jgi:type I restriction enzyme S subunit